MCGQYVLEGSAAECVVVDEQALRGVLGEDDSTPCGDVFTRGRSVGEPHELAVEFYFFRFWGRAGHPFP